MSTVTEFKAAAQQLSSEDRWELFRWLASSKDVQQLQQAELRREIKTGLEQAERGELAPLDIAEVKSEVKNTLSAKRR